MASEDLGRPQPQRMENGGASSHRMLFQDDVLQSPRSVADHSAPKPRVVGAFLDDRFPRRQGTELPRGYGPPGHNWNTDGDTGSEGDEEDDDDDDVEDDELDEGDGEVDGLVGAGVKNGNNSSGSVQSSSDRIHGGTSNLQDHHLFGSSGGAKDGNGFRGSLNDPQHQQERMGEYSNAVTVVEPEQYSSQALHGGDGRGLGQKNVGGEDGYGFGTRKEMSLSIHHGDSLKTHLSDPITGVLMDDAMILPCGHSFGSSGMQHIYRMVWNYYSQLIAEEKYQKACYKCSRFILEDSVRPNLSLRCAVQAFRREVELQSVRASKRRRDRFEQDKCGYDDPFPIDSRGKGFQFPFAVSDRVIIKGNKRTPQRFVGRVAVVTTQCLNGWYVVKTLDNAESVKLQYRSLAKVPEGSPSNAMTNKPIPPSWL